MNRPEEGTLVRIRASDVALEGNLAIPPNARGVVMFAHGSGPPRGAEARPRRNRESEARS